MKSALKNFLIVGGNEFIRDIQVMVPQLARRVDSACSLRELSRRLRKEDLDIILVDVDAYRRSHSNLRRLVKSLRNCGKDFIFVSGRKSLSAIIEARDAGAVDYLIKPYNYREFVVRLNAILQSKIRIACIGGGTGLFNLLVSLKELPNVLLTSIVNTSDDGGSSGELKVSFGILPPGDIRRSLVALSNAPEVMNQVMQYRFKDTSSLGGHTVGNLLLAALTHIKGSMSEAVRNLGDILNIQGIVVPIAQTRATLCALFEDGTVIRGESNIDLGVGRNIRLPIKRCWHDPAPSADMNACAAIIFSDIVTIGPGDLFTSVITSIMIAKIRDALAKTHAKKIYLCNLMTEPGETTGFSALQHSREIIRYLGGDHVDYILIADPATLSKKSLKKYARKKQAPVALGDLRELRTVSKAQLLIADLAHETQLIRHHSQKLRRAVSSIIRAAYPTRSIDTLGGANPRP
ncbi:MAG: uridine diphosphate-N-acetylglucosamine-binding protein YvcK [Candidatus Omnitrophica bacterium]|nr:uridine diphosphate-N-acetylglucosamine-binding protein YvcK [Candidatus Omnitrophota bacterium]